MPIRSEKEPDSLYIIRPTLGQGGADRVTLNLLQTIDRELFEPHLVLMRREGVFLEDVPPDVPVHSLHARSMWTAWLPAVRLLRRQQPDILFSTSSGANILASLSHVLARQHGRLVLSERNTLHHHGLTSKRWLSMWLKKILYPRADHITVISAGLKQDLVDKLGLDPDGITVVYNPVVDEDILRQAKKEVDHPWFRDDTPVVLGAGRLVVQKDYATLIRAFKEVRDRQEARLVILGEGPLRGVLQDLVNSLELTESVSLPGFDKNPFRYMARCSVFVLSSIHEGLGNVLIQAMATGAAVVATDCPYGPAEIIDRPGENGFLVPVRNRQAMAEKITYLLDNPEARREMGELARVSAGRFEEKAITRRYERALLDGAGAVE